MDPSEIKAWTLMTSPGKRFQTRSRRKCGGEENLPKGREDGKERRGMEPVLLLPGIDSLISLIV